SSPTAVAQAVATDATLRGIAIIFLLVQGCVRKIYTPAGAVGGVVADSFHSCVGYFQAFPRVLLSEMIFCTSATEEVASRPGGLRESFLYFPHNTHAGGGGSGVHLLLLS